MEAPSTDTAEPRPRGRPSDYSDEVAIKVIEGLSNGIPLAVICRGEDMPCDDTVRNWGKADPAFGRAIARAREVGFDVIAHRSRLTLRGKTEEEGGESTGDVQRDKAIADHDLKLLAKWDPKRYGDKMALVGGGKGDAPIQLASLTDGELAARIKQLAGDDEDQAGA